MPPKKREKTLDDYIQEAAGQTKPFRLPISDDLTLEIEAPSLNAMIEFENTLDGLKRLELVVGKDHYEKLIELLGDKPYLVFNKITDDIRDHFGLGETPASPS